MQVDNHIPTRVRMYRIQSFREFLSVVDSRAKCQPVPAENSSGLLETAEVIYGSVKQVQRKGELDWPGELKLSDPTTKPAVD